MKQQYFRGAERDRTVGLVSAIQLIAAAADDRILAKVAAGSLEDLLSRAPDRFIERAEREARREPKFRRCVTGAWGIPQQIKYRVAKYTLTVKDPL